MIDHEPLRGPALLSEVQSIFGKMITRYGMPNVTKKWEGTELMHVHMDWVDVLDGCTRAMLWHAAGNLPPTFPPTATEFRSLCIGAPAAPEPLQIAQAPADPAKVKAVIAEAYAKGRSSKADEAEAANVPARLMWAWRLKLAHQRGAKLNQAQITTYRAALASRLNPGAVLSSGFQAPPIESLPAAMRADLYPQHGQHQEE